MSVWSIYWHSKAMGIVITGLMMGAAFSVILIPGFNWLWTPVITIVCPILLIGLDISLSYL